MDNETPNGAVSDDDEDNDTDITLEDLESDEEESEESEKESKTEEGEADKEEGEEGKETAPRPLTSAGLEAALQTPEGQRVLMARLNQFAREAQTVAEAKETLERARALVANKDFEGLGKEYVRLLAKHEKAVEEKRQQDETASKAVEFFYQNVLPTIAEKSDHKKVLAAMSQEERWAIHPDNPKFAGVSEAEYVAAYLDGINTKKGAVSVEDRAKKLFNEWKTAEQNKQTGNIVRGGSTVNTPAAKPGEATSNDHRALIRAGIQEALSGGEEEES